MKPFEKKGEIPAWEVLYNAFHNRDYNARITKSEIQELLKDYKEWRTPIYLFVRKLEERDHKTLRTVRGEGYLIARPNEHTDLGAKRVLRARRQTAKGRRTLGATNISLLTPTERSELANMESKVNRIMKAINKRTEEAEVRAKEKAKENDDIREHLSDIEAKLARLTNLAKKKSGKGYA